MDLPPLETSVWRAVVRVLRSPLRPALDDLSCALFPSSCALCGEPLLRLNRVPVCNSCWGCLRPQTGTLCGRCGEDLGIETFSIPMLAEDRRTEGRECQPCRLAPPAFVKAVAFGVYQTELRSLIHLFKYRGMRPIAGRLGRLLAGCLEGFAGADSIPRKLLVAPAPMHRAKQRQRGFNPAELLARATIDELRRLDPRWELSLDTKGIERIRATASQSGLTARQRRVNLRGAFAVRRPERVAGRDILLIDDVYTTGATARACSRVLLRAGAASVRVATAARAQREGVAHWDKPGEPS